MMKRTVFKVLVQGMVLLDQNSIPILDLALPREIKDPIVVEGPVEVAKNPLVDLMKKFSYLVEQTVSSRMLFLQYFKLME